MIRSRVMLVLVVATVTFAAACSRTPNPQVAQEPDTRAADGAAIRAASAAWSQATQAKDLDKAVSFYADDAMEFADKGPLVSGKDNLRQGWQKMLALPGPGLSFTTTAVEVARSGDMAYEYGAYDFATAGKRSKVTHQKGKYVVVWKKQADGSWKAAIDIDNADQ
ncbi:MAG: YybH family protein [Candidatus Acidiferrales bacterium]